MASEELLQVRNAFKTLQDISKGIPDLDFVISPEYIKIYWKETEYVCTPIKAFHLINAIKQLNIHEENYDGNTNDCGTEGNEVAY